MARATHIYAVVEPLGDGKVSIRGAFTVKHEAASWLRQRPDAELDELEVHRHHDGRPSRGWSAWTAREFLA